MNEQNDPRLNEALHQAYPSQQPSPELHGRMVDAERNRRVQQYRSGSGWRKGWLVALGSLAVLSVLGFTVYKIFFDRPGEAAIGLIPSDADLVMTLDTNPSTRQIGTFKKIADALSREGILDKVDGLITMTLDQNPAVRQIRPYVAKSLALAVWAPKEGQPGAEPKDVAVFLALTDTGAVRDTLTKYLHREEHGALSIYSMDQKGCAAIIGDYLVFSKTAELLDRIYQVQQGRAQSIAQLPAYKSARASLASDSNFMFFLSTDALNMLDEKTKSAGNGISPFGGAEWLAFGAAIREDGIEFMYQCPMDESRMPALRHLGEIKALDPQILNKLPEGAYGVLAYSQPSKYWSFLSETATQKPKERADFEQGLAKFEKETGMSIPRDIVPAFDGNLLLAAYPSPTMGTESADGLIVLDDANGADPATTIGRLRQLLERKSAEDSKPVKFVSETYGGVTVWKLDPQSQAKFRDGFKGRRSEEAIPATPNYDNPFAPPSKPGIEQFPPAPAPGANPGGGDGPSPMQDKTLTYAQIGNAVLIASSDAMLHRAIEAYQGHGASLAGDPAFAYGAGRMRDNAQSLVVINLHRIMEAIRPHIEQSGAPVNVDDIVNLFGGPGVSLVGSGSYDGKMAVGEMFLPLDYERLIGLIGSGMKGDQRPKGPPATLQAAPHMGALFGRSVQTLARL